MHAHIDDGNDCGKMWQKLEMQKTQRLIKMPMKIADKTFNHFIHFLHPVVVSNVILLHINANVARKN